MIYMYALRTVAFLALNVMDDNFINLVDIGANINQLSDIIGH